MHTPLERAYNVLLVDPNSQFLQQVSDALTQHGLHVTTTDSAAAGLEQLRTGAYDVAAVNLPLLGGAALLHQIKAAGIDTSVMVVTNGGERDDVVEALNLGVVYWFQQAHLNLDQLAAKVIEIAQVIPFAEVERILSAIPDE